jgi:magnesium-transporting ATPase (P-type)
VPIDAAFIEHFHDVAREMAWQGERVLGFARRRLELVRRTAYWGLGQGMEEG